MAASAPVLGTTQNEPRPVTWTYELTEEDEAEMQTAIELFSGHTLVGRLVGTTPSRPTVREWIESALGGSTSRILELSMMGSGLFLETMVVADAPARALVLFGDGLMQSVSHTHSNLHALAASGACGFLALRHCPPHLDDLGRSSFEMQQLLDVHQSTKMIKETGSPPLDSTTSMELNIPTIAERFMGMKAALITNSEPIGRLGESLGFTVTNGKVGLSFTKPATCNTAPQLPTSTNVASELLQLLGLSTSKNSENFELVLLHVSDGSGDDVSNEYLNWIDAIIGEVRTSMQPGTKANDHLYLALVLSYGSEAALQANLEGRELRSALNALPTCVRLIRPQQTHKMKDGKPIDDVRDHNPMLVVHQMDGVTRRDSAMSLGFEEFCKNGCNLTILADRFLHELAFKLWKAPKYGA
ncbi:hypothetical protein L7F22_051093 [Adiantum nelumboides]|nr:hypothetical protein [Adiantum nelumboides]